jgi:hypothetical protein
MCRYMCIYCGPPAPSDFTLVQDTDREAYAIMDNFKAAIAGKCVSLRPPSDSTIMIIILTRFQSED